MICGMDMYEDPRTWAPEPVRPKRQLVLRFLATVLYLPVLVVVAVVSVAVMFVVLLVGEVIGAFSSTVERGADRSADRVRGAAMRFPAWCVTWRELRHEGDTEHYRARVDGTLARWTEAASRPVEPKKPRPPVECAVPLRDYRGVGGRYVAEAATAQGWEVRPSDVSESVRLWWSAASRTD